MQDWYAPALAVEALLQRRADRGVFRSFASLRVQGQLECSLVWLRERPMRIVFNPKRSRFEFRDLLPGLPRDTELYKELRRFVKGRAAADLPSYRRIDPDRVTVRCSNRKGSVSVALESLDSDWEYVVGKGLKLVNEIFLGFLRGPYFEYMVENFQERED